MLDRYELAEHWPYIVTANMKTENLCHHKVWQYIDICASHLLETLLLKSYRQHVWSYCTSMHWAATVFYATQCLYNFCPPKVNFAQTAHVHTHKHVMCDKVIFSIAQVFTAQIGAYNLILMEPYSKKGLSGLHREWLWYLKFYYDAKWGRDLCIMYMFVMKQFCNV